MRTTGKGAAPQNIAFSALVSGAWASAAVALLFLIIDGSRGNPLYTPSLLGSALFLGEAPGAGGGIRMDLVAAYSVVHFLAFAAVGWGSTVLYLSLEPLRRQPLLLAGALVAVLSLGALSADAALAPGLLVTVGSPWIVLANVVAAGVMTWFVHRSMLAVSTELAPSTARSSKV